jgi:putative flippase GtrA
VGIQVLAGRQRVTRGHGILRSGPVDRRSGRAQILSFCAVGLTTTAAYFGLFWLLRAVAAPVLANLLALLVTALANTAANRRLTFGVRAASALVAPTRADFSPSASR